MADLIRETVTTQTNTSAPDVVMVENNNSGNRTQKIEYLIYFLFGALDVLLGFRFVLKLLGANAGSGFVSFVYGLSSIFIMPFEGIFRRAVSDGIETASVLEPATIVAVIVYGLLAWGMVKLVRLLSGE
jgi:hypothetical protein